MSEEEQQVKALPSTGEKAPEAGQKAKDGFDMIGNAPEMWFSSAMDLLTASAELGRASKEAAQKFNLPFDIPVTRSLWPRLTLRAFAIECLIKAHLLLAGKKLCEGGKYKGPAGHDLAKLARQAHIATSIPQADLLNRLSVVAVGVGRYPILKNVDSGQKASSGRLLATRTFSGR
jgi:hypothetical protein